MRNSLEILDKKNQLMQRAEDIVNVCKKEIRKMNTEEIDEFNRIKQELIDLNEELRGIEEQFETNNNKETNKETRMEKKFSLVRAIRSVANNKPFDEVDLAVINKGAEEARNSGIAISGSIQLPSVEDRAAVTVTTEHDDIIATDLYDVMGPVLSKNILTELGVSTLTGLKSDVQIPVASAASCEWASENGAPTGDANVTFTNVNLRPLRLTTVLPVSKSVIMQDTAGVENYLRNAIVEAISQKIEETVFSNDAEVVGVSPAGLFNLVTPTAVADFAALVDKEADLEDYSGEKKYALAPKAKAALRNMAKSAKSTNLVMEGGYVDGTEALTTSHIKNKNYIYGDWSKLMFASWGTTDIVVDNVTLAHQNLVRLIINVFVNVKPLDVNAFVAGTLQ